MFEIYSLPIHGEILPLCDIKTCYACTVALWQRQDYELDEMSPRSKPLSSAVSVSVACADMGLYPQRSTCIVRVVLLYKIITQLWSSIPMEGKPNIKIQVN